MPSLSWMQPQPGVKVHATQGNPKAALTSSMGCTIPHSPRTGKGTLLPSLVSALVPDAGSGCLRSTVPTAVETRWSPS